MTPTNSPAGRLYMLLSKLSVGNHDLPAFDFVCSAFDIEPRDPSNSYKAWTKVLNLVDQVENAIQVLPTRKQEIYAGSLKELQKHLSIRNWDASWRGVGGVLCVPNCFALQNLELCAWDLSNHGQEIEAEDLAKLKKSIADLLEEVLSAQLSDELRIFLIEKLREIQTAVDDYVFYGSEGLYKALESVLGGAHLQGHATNSESLTLKRFWEIVKNTSSLLSLVNNVQRFIPAFSSALEAAQDHLS